MTLTAAETLRNNMARVVVQPSGIILETKPGESIMAAAIRIGARWPSVCGGNGECGACVMRVDRGAELLPQPGPEELRRLDDVAAYASGHARLACQAVPRGGALTVRRTGVRPPQPGAGLQNA